MRRSPILLMILVAAIAVAGCGAPQAIPAEVAATTVTQGSPTLAPTAALTEAPAQTAAPPTPTARAGLEATDPTRVNLASGTPVLLEFFAFW